MVSKQELLKAIAAARAKGYTVFAPVREGALVLLAPVEDPASIDFDHVLTVNTLKDVLLPRNEKIAALDLTKMDLRPSEDAESPILVFGSRPCDAAALRIMDAILVGPVHDQRYQKRRERTVIATLACASSDDACFCTSMGYGPHDPTGSDVLVVPVGGEFAVRHVSAAGKAFLDQVGLRADGAVDASAAAQEGAVPEIKRKVDVSQLKAWLDQNFSSPAWNEVSENCASCGTCYYLCPTCHCFDIADETGLSRGERVRIWDACSFSGFTKMAGHQPRVGRHARYRQRVMHKFAYLPDTVGMVACVGDGRCIRHCPYGVDICEVIDKLLATR